MYLYPLIKTCIQEDYSPVNLFEKMNIQNYLKVSKKKKVKNPPLIKYLHLSNEIEEIRREQGNEEEYLLYIFSKVRS